MCTLCAGVIQTGKLEVTSFIIALDVYYLGTVRSTLVDHGVVFTVGGSGNGVVPACVLKENVELSQLVKSLQINDQVSFTVGQCTVTSSVVAIGCLPRQVFSIFDVIGGSGLVESNVLPCFGNEELIGNLYGVVRLQRCLVEVKSTGSGCNTNVGACDLSSYACVFQLDNGTVSQCQNHLFSKSILGKLNYGAVLVLDIVYLCTDDLNGSHLLAACKNGDNGTVICNGDIIAFNRDVVNVGNKCTVYVGLDIDAKLADCQGIEVDTCATHADAAFIVTILTIVLSFKRGILNTAYKDACLSFNTGRLGNVYVKCIITVGLGMHSGKVGNAIVGIAVVVLCKHIYG